MPLAYIALGANLPGPAGPPEAALAAAAERLAESGRITARSSLYSTAPVGLPGQIIDQPRFVNAVVALDTTLAPRDLLATLLGLEKEFGRNRSAQVPNGPRTLDLDLILYGDESPGERIGQLGRNDGKWVCRADYFSGFGGR